MAIALRTNPFHCAFAYGHLFCHGDFRQFLHLVKRAFTAALAGAFTFATLLADVNQTGYA